MSFSSGLGGLRLSPGYLDRDGQAGLLAAVRGILADAPLFVPRMPKSGRAFTVRIRRPWPPIPAALLTTWHELARYPDPPQACLINFYGPGAKMVCIRTVTRRILTLRWFRFRSAIPACFGSAG